MAASQRKPAWRAGKDAAKLLKTMALPDVPVYAATLISDHQLTPEIGHEIIALCGKDRNDQPAVVRLSTAVAVFRELIKRFPVVGHTDSARLAEFQAEGVPFMKEETFWLMCELTAKCGDATGPRSVLAALLSTHTWPSAFFVNHMLASYGYLNDVKAALELAEGMYEFGLEPHESTYIELLKLVAPAPGRDALTPTDFMSIVQRYHSVIAADDRVKDPRRNRVLPDNMRVLCLMASLAETRPLQRENLREFIGRMVPVLRKEDTLLAVLNHSHKLVKLVRALHVHDSFPSVIRCKTLQKDAEFRAAVLGNLQVGCSWPMLLRLSQFIRMPPLFSR